MKKVNKKDLIIYLVIFLITVIIFFPLLKGHYATDSYNIFHLGYHEYAIKYSLNDGRVFMALLGLIAEKINISIEAYVFLTLFLALMISNINVIVLKNIIKKYKDTQNIYQEIALTVICYITIFNFMYLENLYFVESIVMSISILLFIISANILVKKDNKYFLKSSILTIIGVMMYQGTIGLFITYTVLFTILKNKNNIKQILIDTIQCGVIAVIGIVFDLILVKIVGHILNMEQIRYGKLSDIPKNLKFIFRTFNDRMKRCAGLFPYNALLYFIISIALLSIAYQLKNDKEDKEFKFISLSFLIIVAVAIIVAFGINITSLSSSAAGRLKNSLGAIVGIVFLLFYVETDFLTRRNLLNIFSYLVLSSFVIITLTNYELIILQHKKVNELEKKDVEKIEQYISNYENETGIKVTKTIGIMTLGRKNDAYFNVIKNKSAYADNAFRTYWSYAGCIEKYTGRKFEDVYVTKDEYYGYLDRYDRERGYECIGDILYVNTYNN